jgi:hypothetical protein
MADEFLYLKGQKSASDVKTVEYLHYCFLPSLCTQSTSRFELMANSSK